MRKKGHKGDEDEDVMTPLTAKTVRRYSSSKDVDAVPPRLALRYKLTDRKRWLNDVVTLLALLGLLLIVIATELCFRHVFPRGSAVYLLFLGLITVSTIALEVILLWYHYIDIQLNMLVHHIKHWQLALHTSWALQIIIEVIVCLIHPFIGLDTILFTVPVYDTQGDEYIDAPHTRFLGDIFTMAMFLRLYLLFRWVVLHSAYGRDLAVQVLTVYNNIKIDFWFVLKSVLNSDPVLSISAIVVGGVLISAWFLRICEANTPEQLGDFSFSNCLWMICITFLTVGYGDLTPATPSGRAIAVLIALFGVGCTALLIGVVSNKLELSRNEQFLHNFVTDTTLRKHLKHEASDIIKHTWLSYRHERGGSRRKAFSHGRKLLRAKNNWRQIKRRLTDISDDTASLEAIYKEQTSNSKQMLELRRARAQEQEVMQELKNNMAEVKVRLNMVQDALDNITKAIE